MPEATVMSFHLLRPFWLVALLPVVAVAALVLRRQSLEAQWGGVIARHLLVNLIVRPERKWSINPVYLVASGMLLGDLCAVGTDLASANCRPSWRTARR